LPFWSVVAEGCPLVDLGRGAGLVVCLEGPLERVGCVPEVVFVG
jgi:hypothetical protein